MYLGLAEAPSYILGHLDLWEQVHYKAVSSKWSLFYRFVQNLLTTTSGYASNGEPRRFEAFLMAGDCNHITRNFGASWYGGCSWYMSATWTPPWKLFQGMDCGHHLFGDDKLACVLFIMLCFPIFSNLSHLQRGKNWLIAKSYNSIALSFSQDQNEISKCIPQPEFHVRQPYLNTPPYPVQSPPTHHEPVSEPITSRARPPPPPPQ
jgi:hypothetical protein